MANLLVIYSIPECVCECEFHMIFNVIIYSLYQNEYHCLYVKLPANLEISNEKNVSFMVLVFLFMNSACKMLCRCKSVIVSLALTCNNLFA